MRVLTANECAVVSGGDDYSLSGDWQINSSAFGGRDIDGGPLPGEVGEPGDDPEESFGKGAGWWKWIIDAAGNVAGKMFANDNAKNTLSDDVLKTMINDCYKAGGTPSYSGGTVTTALGAGTYQDFKCIKAAS